MAQYSALPFIDIVRLATQNPQATIANATGPTGMTTIGASSNLTLKVVDQHGAFTLDYQVLQTFDACRADATYCGVAVGTYDVGNVTIVQNANHNEYPVVPSNCSDFVHRAVHSAGGPTIIYSDQHGEENPPPHGTYHCQFRVTPEKAAEVRGSEGEHFADCRLAWRVFADFGIVVAQINTQHHASANDLWKTLYNTLCVLNHPLRGTVPKSNGDYNNAQAWITSIRNYRVELANLTSSRDQNGSHATTEWQVAWTPGTAATQMVGSIVITAVKWRGPGQRDSSAQVIKHELTPSFKHKYDPVV